MKNCDLCGKEGLTEFTVKSKHLRWNLSEDLQKLDTHKNNWLTKNICEDCFKKIFEKTEENYTIEQNCGENRIESGVLSVSGSVLSEVKPITAEDLKEDKDMSHKLRDTVKTMKHYRPFKDCDELIETFQSRCDAEIGEGVIYPTLYKPCIWVKSKRYKVDNLITAFDNDNESIGGSCVFIQDMWVDMQELFDNFTFLDGSPCGISE